MSYRFPDLISFRQNHACEEHYCIIDQTNNVWKRKQKTECANMFEKGSGSRGNKWDHQWNEKSF